MCLVVKRLSEFSLNTRLDQINIKNYNIDNNNVFIYISFIYIIVFDKMLKPLPKKTRWKRKRLVHIFLTIFSIGDPGEENVFVMGVTLFQIIRIYTE